jgi:hypothetical protein
VCVLESGENHEAEREREGTRLSVPYATQPRGGMSAIKQDFSVGIGEKDASGPVLILQDTHIW